MRNRRKCFGERRICPDPPKDNRPAEEVKVPPGEAKKDEEIKKPPRDDHKPADKVKPEEKKTPTPAPAPPPPPTPKGPAQAKAFGSGEGQGVGKQGAPNGADRAGEADVVIAVWTGVRRGGTFHTLCAARESAVHVEEIRLPGRGGVTTAGRGV